jgi:prolyl-tRNA editing enzyme YbaK/EbsC (Cys-tRNA(Pro) deacylase)
MDVFNTIIKLLNDNHIQYRLTEHEPVRTSIEAANVRGVDLKTGVKAMVIKAKDKFYLMVLPGDKKLDWKKVKSILNVKEVRFATEEEAEKLTHVEMGSVPPFGNILGMEAYFDPGILENEGINFNPGSKIHSIQMKSADLVKLIKPTFTSLTQ